jgi:hypothetical protein
MTWTPADLEKLEELVTPWLESARKDFEKVLPPVYLQHKKQKEQEQVLSKKTTTN